MASAPGARRLRELGLDGKAFTMSQARQALGITRRVAVPLLEYLDHTRRTERLPGDLRRLQLPEACFNEATAAWKACCNQVNP